MKRLPAILFVIAVLIAVTTFLRPNSDWSRPRLPQADRPHAVVYEIDIPSRPDEGVHDETVALTLAARLDDHRLSIREDAVESLGALGGAEAIAGLGYALSDQDGTVRRLAIEGLARLGNDEAVGMLALVLNEPDAGLRELAIDELADIGSDAAVVVLQSFLADNDLQVRALAAEAIGAETADDPPLL
jgi:HEAT repeat protein